MPGQSSSADSCDFRDFFGRRDPRVPAVPASLLDGKEGVDGSSPSEGFKKPLQMSGVFSLLVAALGDTRSHRGRTGGRGRSVRV